MPAPLRFWHVASLDAPTVAVVWSYAFAWAAQVRLPVWAPVVLALIAWALYIADRLLDARAGMQSPPLHLLRDRHRFHWKYRRILTPAGLLAGAGAAGVVIARLPPGARVPDSAVAAATLAYFSGVHLRGRTWRAAERMLAPFSLRAMLIGVLFTAGCLLPAASQLGPGALQPLAGRLAIPSVFFAVLAWLNCDAIGRWESDRRASAGNKIEVKATIVASAGAMLSVFSAAKEPHAACLLIAGALSAMLFVWLERMRARLTPLALRATADLVLLTPALLLAFRG